jgi:hypothetical protein
VPETQYRRWENVDPRIPEEFQKKQCLVEKVRTNSLRGAVFSKNRLATLWDARDSEHSQQL